jgi:hypothetical protein
MLLLLAVKYVPAAARGEREGGEGEELTGVSGGAGSRFGGVGGAELTSLGGAQEELRASGGGLSRSGEGRAEEVAVGEDPPAKTHPQHLHPPPPSVNPPTPTVTVGEDSPATPHPQHTAEATSTPELAKIAAQPAAGHAEQGGGSRSGEGGKLCRGIARLRGFVAGGDERDDLGHSQSPGPEGGGGGAEGLRGFVAAERESLGPMTWAEKAPPAN